MTVLPPLPGADQDVLTFAAERDLEHRLHLTAALAKAVIKTERSIPMAKRRELIADLDRELGELGI